jgi:peptidoglycan/xylan/chitin deacetylase (PgdA/CDA1 family)
MFAAYRVKTRVRQLVQRAGRRVIWRGPDHVRRIALTFDDGPEELTTKYLDVLDRHGVAATFFVMGDLTEQRQAMIPEYLRRGHQVGSHGYDHTRMTTLSTRQLLDQLDRTAAAIGPVPQGLPWVRPPYGAFNPAVLAAMLARGYTVGMWSVDSHDFEDDPAQILARCAPERVGPGDVLLFHEGYPHTLAALPRVIDGLVDAGYELVTMADLFAA